MLPKRTFSQFDLLRPDKHNINIKAYLASSPNVALWLDAGSINQTDNTAVTSWTSKDCRHQVGVSVGVVHPIFRTSWAPFQVVQMVTAVTTVFDKKGDYYIFQDWQAIKFPTAPHFAHSNKVIYMVIQYYSAPFVPQSTVPIVYDFNNNFVHYTQPYSTDSTVYIGNNFTADGAHDASFTFANGTSMHNPFHLIKITHGRRLEYQIFTNTFRTSALAGGKIDFYQNYKQQTNPETITLQIGGRNSGGIVYPARHFLAEMIIINNKNVSCNRNVEEQQIVNYLKSKYKI
jgi:hypothetical protein